MPCLSFYERSNVVFAVALLSSASIMFGLIGHLAGFTGFDSPTAQSILFRFAISFLVINICYFCYLLCTTYRNKQHKRLLQQQLAIEHVQLQQHLGQKLQHQQAQLHIKSQQELAVAHEKFKTLQSEVKKTLHSLQSLAKHQQNAYLEKQLVQITHINHQFHSLYQTGDAVLDTVLSSKEAAANAQYIQLQTSIGLPPQNSFDSLDVGTILINLFDNAINALTRQDNTAHRNIILYMATEDTCYKIEMKNPVDACHQSIKSTGLGLKIVKELVNKYQGSLQIHHEDCLFTVVIYLPFKSKSQ